MENTIGIVIYLDTVTLQEEGDNNLICVYIPEEYARKYASENKNYSSFEEWKENYTADETEDLFNRLIMEDIPYTLEEI